MPSYHCINKPRLNINKRAKRGSGGIILFIHDSIKPYVELQENKKSEDRIWISFKDPVLQVSTYCCFCYVPPESSIMSTNERSQWSTIELEVIKFLAKGPVILCGDFNARTGTMYDFIQEDSDLPINLPYGYVIDKSMKTRISQDTKVSTLGKYLVDMCISCRLRFLNGRHKGDYWGKFTCFTPRGCSVVDYGIVSAELYDKVTDISVGELQTFSDHCPIKLAMNLPLKRSQQFGKHSTRNETHSLLQLSNWNDQVRVEFDEELKQKSFLYQRLRTSWYRPTSYPSSRVSKYTNWHYSKKNEINKTAQKQTVFLETDGLMRNAKH